jgi:hypothetical protein
MIAISYRREDSTPIAGRLYDRLQGEFGKTSVFMDFDSIPYGVDFREHITQTLEQASALVVVIGPHWSESRDGVRRLDDSTDFVRFEVKSALERGIAIIPVLVNSATMPKSEQLPGDIEGLAFRNALVLDAGVDFHHHTDRLISALHGVIDPPRGGQRSRNSSSRLAATGGAGANRWRRKWAIGLLTAAVAAAALMSGWWWLSREHESPQAQERVTAPIEGRWLLRLSDQPPTVKPETYMRVTVDGTRLKVIGDSWSGVGSFNGEEGYYDWEFHDESGRTGSTKIRLDREGYLHGEVNGSGINWSYWASRQSE